MPEVTLTLTGGSPETIEPSPTEERLRALYAQRPGTLRLGMLTSSDGHSAGPDGSSRSLYGPADVRVLQVLRALADVVIVGGNTARLERYGPLQLSEALQSTRNGGTFTPLPTLAIVTFSGNLPAGVSPADTVVITTAEAPAVGRLRPQWGSRLVIAGVGELSPRSAIKELALLGMTRVLCEGGPQLAKHFLDRQLVNDYCLSVSGVAGGAATPLTPRPPAHMKAAHTLEGEGGFTMTRWVA